MLNMNIKNEFYVSFHFINFKQLKIRTYSTNKSDNITDESVKFNSLSPNLRPSFHLRGGINKTSFFKKLKNVDSLRKDSLGKREHTSSLKSQIFTNSKIYNPNTTLLAKGKKANFVSGKESFQEQFNKVDFDLNPLLNLIQNSLSFKIKAAKNQILFLEEIKKKQFSLFNYSVSYPTPYFDKEEENRFYTSKPAFSLPLCSANILINQNVSNAGKSTPTRERGKISFTNKKLEDLKRFVINLKLYLSSDPLLCLRQRRQEYTNKGESKFRELNTNPSPYKSLNLAAFPPFALPTATNKLSQTFVKARVLTNKRKQDLDYASHENYFLCPFPPFALPTATNKSKICQGKSANILINQNVRDAGKSTPTRGRVGVNNKSLLYSSSFLENKNKSSLSFKGERVVLKSSSKKDKDLYTSLNKYLLKKERRETSLQIQDLKRFVSEVGGKDFEKLFTNQRIKKVLNRKSHLFRFKSLRSSNDIGEVRDLDFFNSHPLLLTPPSVELRDLSSKQENERSERGVFSVLDKKFRKIDLLTAQTRLSTQFLEKALNNVKPNLEVRKVRRGGTTYQVPTILREKRSEKLGIQWLIECAQKNKKKSKSSFSESLANELVQAFHKSGEARQKRNQLLQLAESNRAYIRYRWW